MDIEGRLSRLERQLVLHESGDDRSSGSSKSIAESRIDLSVRVAALERSVATTLGSGAAAEWSDMDDLWQDLSPGTALTHQKQIMAPILYRRAEVLAAASLFEADLKQVAQIQSLLLVSAPAAAAASNKQLIAEQQVMQASILQTDSSTIADDQLESLAASVVDLQTQIRRLSTKLDRLLANYSSLVGAVSEKLVLADEAIQLREQKNEQ
jgi:hypothetical protein